MNKLITIPPNTNEIEMRKKLNKLLSDSRKLSKPTKCILCGNPQTSFCNSHSVPQMSLKTISQNGKLLQSTGLVGIELVDIEKGVNNSGTFNYICNSCDRDFFRDYETYENLMNRPSDKILGEIAVKNILLQISKRTMEQELYTLLQNEYSPFEQLDVLKDIQKMDISEYSSELEFHKNIVDNDIKNGYRILYWNLLPYTVPIAIQSAMTLDLDLENNEVNNIYKLDPSVRMQYLHLCVFPLKEQSYVLLFYHKRDKNYNRLRHQFNCLSQEKKLSYINYLIFTQTENYFMSLSLSGEVKTNKLLQKASQELNHLPSLGFLGYDNHLGLDYTPVKIDDLPNFLSPEWALK